ASGHRRLCRRPGKCFGKAPRGPGRTYLHLSHVRCGSPFMAAASGAAHRAVVVSGLEGHYNLLPNEGAVAEGTAPQEIWGFELWITPARAATWWMVNCAPTVSMTRGLLLLSKRCHASASCPKTPGDLPTSTRIFLLLPAVG